jgi:hypothetical protein
MKKGLFYLILLTLLLGLLPFAWGADRGEIRSGETKIGLEIVAASYMDIWTLNGDQGDRVILNAVTTSGGLDTCITLFPPGGVDAEVTTCTSLSCVYYASPDKLDHQLSQDGPYTIVVQDDCVSNSGTYNITFLKIPGSVSSGEDPDGGPIASGETLSGTINAASDMDAFQFYGQSGERIILNAVTTSGDLDTCITLYPEGGGDAEVTTCTSLSCVYYASADKLDHQLSQSGLYTIVVKDDCLSNSGTYNITFLKIPGAVSSGGDPDGGLIASGETLSGTINAASDMDAFQFYGQSGERIILNAVTTSGGLDTCITLYPEGGGVAEATTCTSLSCVYYASADKLDHQLSQSGLYTIVVQDDCLSNSGTYNITFLKIPGAVSSIEDHDGGAIVPCGETLTPTVDVASDMDAFQFYGQAGERIILNAVTTSGSLDTCITLYPEGGGDAEVTTCTSLSCVYYASADKLDHQLTYTGLYTVVIQDDCLSNSGTFNISLTKIPSCTPNPGIYHPSPAECEIVCPSAVSLIWDPVSGATGYDVYFGEDVIEPLVQIGDNIQTPPISLPQIQPKNIYYWHVVAHTPTGDIQGPYWWFETTECDTTPDAFTFIDQTGVALNTMVMSNTITVSGINAATPISITGGAYSIDGGGYTSSPGAVNNNNTVRVRVTSSGSYSTTVDATLTIGGVSDTFSVTTIAQTSQPFPFLDDFSTDKGWVGYEIAGWERGPAIAGGGENGNPDPGSDHSPSADNYILGFAIGADYSNDLLVEKSIISPPIDCTGQSRVFLKFWRYLNMQSDYYDHAKVYVSNDGTNWTQLWENPVFDLTDNQWTQVVFDISAIAANQPTVYIKFSMGPTDSSMRFSGWNIDDLEITSDYSGLLTLYVPSGDIPNPNIDEMLIQNGFGIKHSSEILSDMSDYDLLILSSNEASDPEVYPNAADYIRNFVQNGGGAIIMNGTPKPLAGNTDNLSTIADWFGAGWYGNDCGYAMVAIDHPFDTNLMVGDHVDYSVTGSCLADSAYGENLETIIISKWATQGRTHAFSHNFGNGRVFYYAGDPGYSEDSDPVTLENGLTLFEAGMLWTAFPDPPSQPTNVSASDGIYTDRIEVTWTASLGATSYKVYRSKSSDSNATKTLLGTTSETLFNDTTAVPMKTYFYWVKASNTYGTTKFSASDKGYRSDGTPLVPTNISASDGTHTNRVEVTWSASLRAESYKVYRSRSSDPEATKVLLGTTTETFLHDTTAVAGRTYFYWVKASNTIGTTKFSAPDKGYR